MPATARSRSQVSARTIWTVALHLLALVALLGVLRQARGVLSWVLVALFLALAAHPPVGWLQRRGLGRGLSVAVVFFLGFGLIGTLVATLIPMLVAQVRSLIEAAPALLDSLQQQRWIQSLEMRFHLIERATEELRARAPQAALPVLGVVTGALHQLAAFVTVTVLTVFFLLFGRSLFETSLLWVAPERRAHVVTLARRIHRRVGGYVAGAFLISLIGGVVTAVTLLLLGVPYFLPLGLAMMVLGILPFVGSFLGAILVVGTTFASEGPRAGLIALGVFLLYQQAENHFLQPMIQRRTLSMNPLIIAVVMLVGTSLAGILGALLALPLAGAAQVIIQDGLARRQARWRALGVPREQILAPDPRPEDDRAARAPGHREHEPPPAPH